MFQFRVSIETIRESRAGQKLQSQRESKGDENDGGGGKGFGLGRIKK
jgi:hypothetical protein